MKYAHPYLTPARRTSDRHIYREAPLRGVEVTYYHTRNEYEVFEYAYDGISDVIGHIVGLPLITTVHSDITEYVDDVIEDWLVPARLSDMMEEFAYRT